MGACSRIAIGLTGSQAPIVGEASAVKWYSSEAATDFATVAVQLFGGQEVGIIHLAKGRLSGVDGWFKR